MPLKREPIGDVPQAGVEPKVFHLSFESLGENAFFKLAGVPEADLRDTYSEPFFFKAVEVDSGDEVLKSLRVTLMATLDAQLREIKELDQREAEFARLEVSGDLSETDKQRRLADQMRRRELRPEWLAWTRSAEFKAVEELPEAEPAAQAAGGGDG